RGAGIDHDASECAMIRYILVRVGLGAVTIWGVVTAVFLALRAVPGGPAAIILQGGAGGGEANPAAIAALENALGLDRPLVEQYAIYLWDLLRGELGSSIRYSSPVGEVMAAPFGNTIVLVVIALIIGLVVGIAFGTISGNWSGVVLDSILS